MTFSGVKQQTDDLPASNKTKKKKKEKPNRSEWSALHHYNKVPGTCHLCSNERFIFVDGSENISARSGSPNWTSHERDTLWLEYVSEYVLKMWAWKQR